MCIQGIKLLTSVVEIEYSLKFMFLFSVLHIKDEIISKLCMYTVYITMCTRFMDNSTLYHTTLAN
jgi:hypothetical protein